MASYQSSRGHISTLSDEFRTIVGGMASLRLSVHSQVASINDLAETTEGVLAAVQQLTPRLDQALEEDGTFRGGTGNTAIEPILAQPPSSTIPADLVCNEAGRNGKTASQAVPTQLISNTAATASISSGSGIGKSTSRAVSAQHTPNTAATASTTSGAGAGKTASRIIPAQHTSGKAPLALDASIHSYSLYSAPSPDQAVAPITDPFIISQMTCIRDQSIQFTFGNDSGFPRATTEGLSGGNHKEFHERKQKARDTMNMLQGKSAIRLSMLATHIFT